MLLASKKQRALTNDQHPVHTSKKPLEYCNDKIRRHEPETNARTNWPQQRGHSVIDAMHRQNPPKQPKKKKQRAPAPGIECVPLLPSKLAPTPKLSHQERPPLRQLQCDRLLAIQKAFSQIRACKSRDRRSTHNSQIVLPNQLYRQKLLQEARLASVSEIHLPP